MRYLIFLGGNYLFAKAGLCGSSIAPSYPLINSATRFQRFLNTQTNHMRGLRTGYELRFLSA
jgi:hypothetical protein